MNTCDRDKMFKKFIIYAQKVAREFRTRECNQLRRFQEKLNAVKVLANHVPEQREEKLQPGSSLKHCAEATLQKNGLLKWITKNTTHAATPVRC